MKTTIKFLLLALAISSLQGIALSANAADSSLSISPSLATVNAGASVNASGTIAVNGNKVCTVKGTLVFTNTTCKSITVPAGFMAQTTPTCASPSFVIGIPKCVTQDTTLFTVSAKAGTEGTASINVASLNIIGVGVSVGSASQGATYTVTAAPAPAAAPATTKTTDDVKVAPEQAQTQDSSATSPATASNPGSASLFSSAKNILSLGTGSTWFAIVVLLLIIAAIWYGVRRFMSKPKKK